MKASTSHIEKAELSETYVVAEHWKSDLEFYHDELHFLTLLINKNFIHLMDTKDLATVTTLADRLKDSIDICQNLQQEVTNYMSNAKLSMSEELKVTGFDQDNTKIKTETVAFEKEFKSLKREIFSLARDVMKHEKMKRLLQA